MRTMALWTILLPLEMRDNIVPLLDDNGIKCEFGATDEFGTQALMCYDEKSYVALRCNEMKVFSGDRGFIAMALTIRRASHPNRYWKGLRPDFGLARKIEAILLPISAAFALDWDQERDTPDKIPTNRNKLPTENC